MPSTSPELTHEQIVQANRTLYNHSAASEEFGSAADAEQFQRYVRRTLQECKSILSSDRNLRVLDVGTGYGHLLTYLIENFPHSDFSAVDVAEKNIETARVKFPQVKFSVGDFLAGFKPETTYHFISCYSVLHHFFDWKPVIEKMDSMLEPGGVIYIDHEPLNGFISNVYQALARFKHRKDKGFLLAEYHQFYGCLDPFLIQKRFMDLNYEVRVYFTNVALVGAFHKHLGFNPIFRSLTEKRINHPTSSLWRHLFMSHKIIAKKKGVVKSL